jgi:hypothetical protein
MPMTNDAKDRPAPGRRRTFLLRLRHLPLCLPAGRMVSLRTVGRPGNKESVGLIKLEIELVKFYNPFLSQRKY